MLTHFPKVQGFYKKTWWWFFSQGCSAKLQGQSREAPEGIQENWEEKAPRCGWSLNDVRPTSLPTSLSYGLPSMWRHQHTICKASTPFEQLTNVDFCFPPPNNLTRTWRFCSSHQNMFYFTMPLRMTNAKAVSHDCHNWTRCFSQENWGLKKLKFAQQMTELSFSAIHSNAYSTEYTI